MNHLFIVNPIAGGRDQTEHIYAQALSAFSARPDSFEIYTTVTPLDATKKVRQLAESGEEWYIYACGGDGTFHECINGAAGFENISVAPIPTGTGNDFCRMFGPQQELYLDFPALVSGVPHKIDLIDVNGHLCAGIASVGIDARVGTNVHSYTHLPFCKGPGAYIASAAVEILKGLTRKMKVTCGKFSYDGDVTLCCVCNGRYYGGGFNPSSNAMPDDGILDIYFVRKMNLIQVVSAIGEYAKGRAEDFPEYITHLRGDSVTITFEDRDVINADGETILADRAIFRIIPQALNLIIPKGMTFFQKNK